MSSYLPDETVSQNQIFFLCTLKVLTTYGQDPTYEAKCATVDAENERLQKKYKLCDSCQALVDMVVSEKMEFLKVRNINRTFASSISEVKVPIRPSKRQYISQAIIYFIIHLYTFSVVIYSKYNYKYKEVDGNLLIFAVQKFYTLQFGLLPILVIISLV